jgi:PAT family beta-lactamase induction signal transducer AmpG
MVTQINGNNSWRNALLIYSRPRVMGMIFLGFSAGLPFLLVFSTLSAWLRDVGISHTTIGFFSWVGITYSIKVFWAPVIDRFPLPFINILLGKRRSWMLLAQILIALGLLGMGLVDPTARLTWIAILSVVVAFGSATQDITIDAYRIEAVDKLYQGAMAATYVLGYRLALLAAGAGVFYIADAQSWSYAYQVMSALMIVGILTTLVLKEPDHPANPEVLALEEGLEESLGVHDTRSLSTRFMAWVIDAAIAPFVEFFKRTGWAAVLILLLIGCYRISDITMGVMANPFYLDMGFSRTDIANVTKVFGFFMTIAGAGLGGILVVRLGIFRPLLAGAILVACTNFLFAWLSVSEPNLINLALVISADNLSGGLASAAFIAYLSSLTNTSYTATQYALFSSFMTLPGKIIGGFSGVVVDNAGYASFFIYAGLLGVPAILLVLLLFRQDLQSPK